MALHRLLKAEAAEAMGISTAGVYEDAENLYDHTGFDELVDRALRVCTTQWFHLPWQCSSVWRPGLPWRME